MRTTHILSTVGIVFLLSACASLRNGSPTCVSCSTGVTSETPQTPSPGEPTADPLKPIAGPVKPNEDPVKPTAEFETAKIIGVTILPDVREIKVGDTVDFRTEVQLSPGVPPPWPNVPGVPPFWGTDKPAVAAVTRGGSLTALAPGEVALSVRFGGMSATRMLRIIP
jgi:hypothetical protein